MAKRGLVNMKSKKKIAKKKAVKIKPVKKNKAKTKPKIGRPTKYTPDFLKIAEEYLEKFHTGYEHVIPSVAGLAEISNIRRGTLHTWANDEDKPGFSYIYERLLAKQERLLIGSGLNGAFNSAITKLVLGKHGYHEKVDKDITSGGEPLKNDWHIHPVTTRKNAKA